ncbi:autotransporter-associated beta strand repeat-containing protein, partial [Akkermansia sp. N21169]|uniref:beta strand repeat-containing protein n=1 Tax=Akkermansia sp. N21169 TaxID=3040765 RepID=UPI00244EAF96
LGSGKLSLEMNGTGSQELTGESTYTGGTTLTAGTLKIGKGSSLGNGGTVLFNGGTLVAADTLELAGHTVMANSGKKIQVAAADGKTMTLSGLQFAGDTNSNNITVGQAGAKGTVVLGGLASGNVLDGALSVLGGATLRLANDDDSGSVTVRHNASNGTLDAIAGTLSKAAGTLLVELDADASLSGRLEATAGTLELAGKGSSRALSLTGALAGASLNLGANVAVTVGTDAQSGTVSVGNMLALDGGSLNLSNGSVSAGGISLGTSASALVLTGGELTVGASGITGSAGTLELGGGMLKSSAAWSTTHVAVLSATGSDATTIDTMGGDITLSGNLSNKSGVASVNLVKSGSGVLTLGGGNASLSGSIKVTGGTLKAASSTAFGAASNEILAEGAKIDLNSQSLSNALVFSGDSTLSGTSAGYAGAVHAKSGTLTLSDASAVLKDVRVSAGATLKGASLTTGGTLTLDLSDMLTRDNSPYVQLTGACNSLDSLVLENFQQTESGHAGDYALLSQSAPLPETFTWSHESVSTDAYYYKLISSSEGGTPTLYLQLARIGEWVWASGADGYGTSVEWSDATGGAKTQWSHDSEFATGPDAQKLLFSNAAVNRNITIIGTVKPWSVTVNNDTGKDYVFNGDTSAGISDNGTVNGVLTKSGEGNLTIGSDLRNTYTGGTLLQGGTILVRSGSVTDGSGNIEYGSLGKGELLFQGGILSAKGEVSFANAFRADEDSAIRLKTEDASSVLTVGGSLAPYA